MRIHSQRSWVVRVLAAVLLLGVAGSGWGQSGKLPPLVHGERLPRLPGKFVWADLVTDDMGKASKFYQELFGWQFFDYGGYLVGMNDGRFQCGIFERARPGATNASPRWFGYISVPNVGRARDAAVKAGARVVADARKLPDRGEQAVLADPEGALFGLIKSSAGDPEDYLAAVGDWVWVELLSRDGRKAGEFYKAVAGYEVVENTESARPDDYVLSRGDYARAAVLTIPKAQEQVRPAWLAFVRVKSVKASIERVEGLGGKVLFAPNESVAKGKAAVVADPTGAAIGLLELSEDFTKGAN